MIKIENVETVGWQAAIRGMRNPLNSWDKSDSVFCWDEDSDCEWFKIGDNDLNLMTKLRKAGTDHRKFMRMITVYVDITAPLYWTAEFDTYKVGTVRNSCSFMHKGTSKPFEITDFSIHDSRVYEILAPLHKKEYSLIYPYETEEFKIYTCSNGRRYEVYKNGRVFSLPFSYADSMGRIRKFEKRECKPSVTKGGYYELNIGGRNGEKWMLHRLVATVWLTNRNGNTVNHKSGNKGDNSVENLEWITLEENIKKGFNDGLYNNLDSLHCKYLKWKNGHRLISPTEKSFILHNYKNSLTIDDIMENYSLSRKQVYNILNVPSTENEELFMLCYHWETILEELNRLRENYLDIKDEEIFQQLRCLLPSGYNVRFTVMLNYEVLANMYKSRKNHKLDEWKQFCGWIKTLPHYELITGEFDESKE